ncbi:hypothetical protein CV_2378 [Chromobacterium violaceum ATCC 12472]|uniref:Uncharacterized protein n=1 Tax=Chromobacterium violaceum (strain ATCC 12472 / DSM 30191 / JCM 1249 / CCUG 213 / NBRC 12614 / NCIMB 9131 / NCTC 9757 / MK) TaxID=243365 RepID=Q7NVG5_CHRVO|nr:hypothetical protein CV_2378 [Chromobacterium violaceum ATCC 12472]
MAGLPALHGSEPGQVRKEAATVIQCKCRGSGSPPLPFYAFRKDNCKFATLLRLCTVSHADNIVLNDKNPLTLAKLNFQIHGTSLNSLHQKYSC